MKKKISVTISVLMAMALMAGCGESVSVDAGRNIELIEPVDASINNLETVHRRNLYEAAVYEANVYPYVEEYSFEDKNYSFAAYGAYPGDEVKKGDILIYTTTENLDKQVESLQKRLQDMTVAHAEYGGDAAEKYAELKAIVTEADWALSDMENKKPAETITANGKQVENPEYKTWKKNYEDWEIKRNKALLDIDILHSENDQKVALYNLDYAYYNGQLQELLDEKKSSSLYSEMDGQVVAIKQVSTGDKLGIGKPLVAVADVSQKLIKCDPIDERLIYSAYDIYVLINGNRYELTYQESEDTRCSTFVLHDDAGKAEIGDYGVVVYLSKGAENVLTISNEAIRQDVTKKYVHILQDGKVVSREIKTGMSDGMFTEILEGLQEGDQVVVNEVKAPGPNTAVLSKEVVSTTYTCSADMYYPDTWRESYQPKYVEGVFIEYLVEAYQHVKVGDPLARISVEGDPMILEEKETELLREKQRLDDYIEANKDKIETNEAIADRITSWQERIDSLEEATEEIRQEYTTTIVTATKDGQVQQIVSGREGKKLSEISYLVSCCDNKTAFVSADSKGLVNYGTYLEVEYTNSDNKREKCTGKVVTLGQYGVSDSLVSGSILVELPEEVLANMQTRTTGPIIAGNRSKPALIGTGKVMKNVITIPSKAVTEIDGKTYVDVLLPDGTVKTTPFISGGNTRSTYWAVDGLDVGMTVCW